VPEGHTRPGERTTNEGNVAFSPDGRYAVIASGDLATPWLLDVSTRKQVREFKGHTDSVRSVAFSPDGHFIATASYDHTARLGDVASGKQVRVFAGHTDGVADVAFSPDGRQLLTGSFDGKAKLWDVATGRQMQEFDRHHAGVVGVAFHLTAAKSSPVALTTRRSYPIYAAVPCCTLFRCSAGTGWRCHPTERTP
jgi:WD40 repeat protein